MSNLPLNLPIEQMQSKWKSQLDPIISNPFNSLSVLKDVVLKVGVNVINHRLGAKQQGWVLTDIQGTAVIYRSAPFNDLTLTLTSDSIVTVSIGVY